MEVLEHHTFRVTRNEDLEVEEDDAENLLQALEKELLRRRFGPPVRLEVTNDINPNIRALLIRELGVEESEVYSVPAPLDLRGLSVIAGIDRADLHYPKHVPHTSRYLNESETSKAANVFAAMRAAGHPPAPPVRLLLHLGPGVPGTGGLGPQGPGHQADPVPHLRRLPDRRRPDRRRRGRQAGPGAGGDQGPLR